MIDDKKSDFSTVWKKQITYRMMHCGDHTQLFKSLCINGWRERRRIRRGILTISQDIRKAGGKSEHNNGVVSLKRNGSR